MRDEPLDIILSIMAVLRLLYRTCQCEKRDAGKNYLKRRPRPPLGRHRPALLYIPRKGQSKNGALSKPLPRGDGVKRLGDSARQHAAGDGLD